MKYMSPRSDVGFKKLFGNPHHKNLTISFLNSILDRKEGNLINKIEFADTEQLPEAEDGRSDFAHFMPQFSTSTNITKHGSVTTDANAKTFFDIYCTDQENNKFIIEMQRKYQAHFVVRAQYYVSLAFYRQMHSPFKYEKLVPVIFIGVLDHILFDEIDDVITRHALMDIKNHTISSLHQAFHIIELKKFKKTIDQLDSEIDKWLFFMNQADELEKIPEEMQGSQKFQDAFYLLERMRWTEQELDEYLAEADAAGKEDRIEQGAIERGLKEGLKLGIEKGIQKGIQKEKEAIVMNGFKKGLDINLIQDLTGLSIEQIEMLRKK